MRFEKKANVFAVGFLPLIVEKEKEQELLSSSGGRRFSGGFDKQGVKRGISIKDEKKFPQFVSMLGKSTNDPNWAAASNDFWAEFSSTIDFGEIVEGKVIGGRTLDVSYEVNEETGEIYADNFNDYILFQLMQTDGSVGIDPNGYSKFTNKEFFCIDQAVESAKTKELLEVKTEATIELAKLLQEKAASGKEAEFRAIAGELDTEVSSIHMRTMSYEEIIQSIIKSSEKNPSKFLTAIKDKNLTRKRFVMDCVAAGFITQVGNTFIYLNENFNSLDSLVNYLGTPDGAPERLKLKTQLEEFAVLA